MESLPPLYPQTLLPSNSLRRRSSSSSISDGATASSSPEFEFWMVGRNNTSNTPDSTHLPSADELFSDGVILPLHLLSTSAIHHHLLSDADLDPVLDPGPTAEENPPSFDSNKTQSGFSCPPQINHEPGTVPDLDPEPSPSILSSSSSCLTSSKRWKDIFKKTDKRLPRTDVAGSTITPNRKMKEKTEVIKKKSDKKRSEKGSSGSSSVAELNINLWPFSRSRSTGNNSTGGKPRCSMSSGRKASSAPCSRSNSSGESKSSRKSWPSSPGRAMMSGGVRVGRSSPVWQVRRNGSGQGEKDVTESSRGSRDRPIGKGRSSGGDRGKNIRVLNMNVPMWVGNRQNMMSCRSYEMFAASKNGGRGGAEDSAAVGGGGVTRGGGRLFNLRGLLTKKVY